LVNVVASLEEGFASEKFGKDTSDRPHVDYKKERKEHNGRVSIVGERKRESFSYLYILALV
jgi:hypothetical protein